MIKMMNEIARYKEIIKSGLTSPRELEEMQRLVDVSTKILEWFEDQGKQVTNANYDTDTGILVFDMQNTSGMDFRELEFDILADESLHTVSFHDWKDGEYRKVHFTHYFDSTDGMSVTLQGDSIAFELYDETEKKDGVIEIETGEGSSYPVKIPLGNWILKNGEDGSKELVSLKDHFGENDEPGLAREEVLDMPVGELGLSVRAYNCIMRAGLTTVRDIVSRTEDEIKGIRNIGQKACEEIKGHLEELGLSFKEPNDEEGIDEDVSYSVDVTGIVDQIIKALISEDTFDEKNDEEPEALLIEEECTDKVKEIGDDDREMFNFARAKDNDDIVMQRFKNARREVWLQCLIARNGEKPSVEEMTNYLKYLGYNDDEIAYDFSAVVDSYVEHSKGGYRSDKENVVHWVTQIRTFDINRLEKYALDHKEQYAAMALMKLMDQSDTLKETANNAYPDEMQEGCLRIVATSDERMQLFNYSISYDEVR